MTDEKYKIDNIIDSLALSARKASRPFQVRKRNEREAGSRVLEIVSIILFAPIFSEEFKQWSV
jgi:hypothetical protein